jgi:hypothetical protein
MLTTAGLGFAIVEARLDDLAFLDSRLQQLWTRTRWAPRAGYGAPIALDRDMTTGLIGFARTQKSAI